MPTGLCVTRVHACDLATATLGFCRMSAEVELAVEARRRLVGDEVERRAALRDIRLLQPERMARTVRIAMARDLLRKYLNASARRRKRMRGWIVAEAAQPAAIVEVLGHVQAAGFPELLETRRGKALRGKQGADRLIEKRQPLPCRAPLGEGLAGAETLSKIGENLIVVARKAVRLGDAVGQLTREQVRAAHRQANDSAFRSSAGSDLPRALFRQSSKCSYMEQ